ncbi:hypothetical protein DICSQDRAFT_140428 [Dichomitus squalens LYAD-421 SS1]|uniref:F-box domain-containing protein n=1 Tax=Dichomitus squalens (strain LYAD-421) TaxID=732165 RepID=R7SMJ9_DICSQ|nr:uncharacterized protein DICSQDRAFT_140428 [Dichomitus squalens LYAD-421 SS1]EJF57399.1 hypothetical protein DICSQDRAFT_140428 [Dichomitus squalens LYAD-421 SS1]
MPPRRSGRLRVQPSKPATNVLDAPYKDSQRITITDLPIEIVRLVIDYLQSDRKTPTLKSCSRLSRSWRDLVFSYLFTAIKPFSVLRLSEFTAFLKSTPHVVPVVKQVVIVRAERVGPAVFKEDIVTFDRESPFVYLVETLRALERLVCQGLVFSPPTVSNAVVDAIPSSSPLRRLVWTGCDARMPDSSARLAPIFSALTLFKADTLDLVMPYSGMVPPEEDITSIRPLAYKTLILRGSRDNSSALSSFRQILAPDCLRSLSVSVGEPQHVVKLGELLHKVGSNLEYLRINFHNMHTPERWAGSVLEALKLESCLRLSSLNITMLWGDNGGRDASHLSGSALAKILKQAPPDLQEIRIPIFPPFDRFGPPEVLDTHELYAVQSIFKQRTLSALRAFIFELTDWGRVEEYGLCLKEMFPDLHERGILKLESMNYGSLDEALDV